MTCCDRGGAEAEVQNLAGLKEDLHETCDFLVANFDARQKARADEARKRHLTFAVLRAIIDVRSKPSWRRSPTFPVPSDKLSPKCPLDAGLELQRRVCFWDLRQRHASQKKGGLCGLLLEGLYLEHTHVSPATKILMPHGRRYVNMSDVYAPASPSFRVILIISYLKPMLF